MSISSASGDIALAIYPRSGSGTTTSLAWPPVMAGSDHQALEVTARPVEGSRSTRRLRKQGLVPGVVYGGGERADHVLGRRVDAPRHAGARRRGARPQGRRRHGNARDRQGRPEPSGARRGHPPRPPARGHEPADPLRGRARAARRRRVARRLRGRRAEPGDARAQHRGAPGRHPGLDHPRRLRPRDERHAHAVRGHRPAGRHAARRPRGDRHRHDHPADAGAGGRGDRDRDRADRRGRRAHRARRGRGGRGRRRRGLRRGWRETPPRTTRAEALLVHPGRLADRRARQPRALLRELPPQRRLPRGRRADRALGPAEAEEEVRR